MTDDNMKLTADVLSSMLTENTGRSFRDSGMLYGRNWQRNRTVDFEKVPASSLVFKQYNTGLDISVTHNVYHWLLERVRFDKRLTELFAKFSEESYPNSDKSYLLLISEFINSLDSRGLGFGKPSGIYGEGEPVSINTYTDDNFLSQILQFTYFSTELGEFIALQIHGGCDIRRGYTAPQFFSVGHLSELDIFDYRKANIYCTGDNHLPEAKRLKEIQQKQLVISVAKPRLIDFDNTRDHYWYNDGNNFIHDGESGSHSLDDYEVIDLSNPDEDDDGNEIIINWEPGSLFIKDGDGYCPICGALLSCS